MSSGWISPSNARCMLVGQTVRTKSAVLGESGSTAAIGSEATLASTKRLGCSFQSAAPYWVIGCWPESVVSITLLALVDRNEIHLKAASLFLLCAKMALDS